MTRLPSGFAAPVRLGPPFPPSWQGFSIRDADLCVAPPPEGPFLNGHSIGRLLRDLPQGRPSGNCALGWGLRSGVISAPRRRLYDAGFRVAHSTADGGGSIHVWAGITLLSGAAGGPIAAKWAPIPVPPSGSFTIRLETTVESEHRIETGWFVEIGWGEHDVPHVVIASVMGVTSYDRLGKEEQGDGDRFPDPEVPAEEGLGSIPPLLQRRELAQERVFALEPGESEQK